MSGASTYTPSFLSDHLDPLAYPLLFPDGQRGWHSKIQYYTSPGVEKTVRQHMSQAEFYSHRLMTRDPLQPQGPIVTALHSGSLQPPQLKLRRVDSDSGPPVLNARACPSTMPHAGGRLFQQFCVDVFTRIESERIDWARRNQPMLRCHTLQGLEDFLHTPSPTASDRHPAPSPHAPCPEASGARDNQTQVIGLGSTTATTGTCIPQHAASAPRSFDPNTAAQEMEKNTHEPAPVPVPGKPIILPASYTGSPRHLHQCYLDAMALVQHCGSKPDLFVTFTANPNWPEVKANLRGNEKASDRMDLVNRVFKQKLRSLLDDIVKREIFGRVIGWT